MTAEDRRILETFASRIRRAIPNVSGIWAFGSRARGDSSTVSDFDVCIVAESITSQIRRQIQDIAWEVGFDNDVLISTVKYDRKSFLDGPCAVSPLVKQIHREGVVA